MSTEKDNNKGFVFGPMNIKLMLAGLAVIFIGFLLMVGGGSKDPNVFNPEIFSTQRITVAPIVVLIGFAIEVVAIMYKPKELIFMSWFEAFIIALVEGLTEFLPVSSTGHMIIAQALMGVPSDEFVKLFTVNIQFGAIISVLVLYWKRFLKSLDFYYKLIIAFIPAAIAGLLLGDAIDSLLESPTVVAITLVLGGILLLKVDDWFKSAPVTYEEALDDPNRHADDVLITYPKAFIIGIFQCIALIPGVSRSAATIIGGLTQGISRKNAAEFSFFLAVPTMAAASGYKLLKVFLKGDPKILTDNIGLLVFGNVVAFIVAMLAIRFFIGFLTKHGFRIFGWYRIAAGLIILLLIAMGVDLSIA